MDESGNVTGLLQAIQSGDSNAVSRLFPMVYRELRRIAAGMMRHERPGHTLQPTAVVHEAYIRIVGGADLNLESRAQFFALAARAMRNVLVDHARHKLADKRGGTMQVRIELEDDLLLTSQQSAEILATHEALERLQELDSRQAKIVEMHYFAGNSVQEIAALCGLGERTVKHELQMARLFIKKQLEGEGIAASSESP